MDELDLSSSSHRSRAPLGFSRFGSLEGSVGRRPWTIPRAFDSIDTAVSFLGLFALGEWDMSL